jgi:hypothetical protein
MGSTSGVVNLVTQKLASVTGGHPWAVTCPRLALYITERKPVLKERSAMRIPQTAERIKEAPAQALRAVFAGVGQVLLITEKVRRRGGSESRDVEIAPETEGASGAVETSGTTTKASTAKASTTKASTAKASTTKRSAAKAAAPKAETPKAEAPKESPKAETPKAETPKASVPKASAPKATARKASAVKPAQEAETESTSVLPLPHYSELSIASLRARLRGLDVAQVRELIAYERTHEDRENVIAMFERRIAKLEETTSTDAPQG